MGLIKSGIKYGALFGVAHEASKAISNNQNRAPSPQPQQQGYCPPPQQQRGQAPFTDASGYVHQSFCNGQCGRKCNGGSARDATGYVHREFCNGACQGLCNGGVRESGAAGEYYEQGRGMGQDGPAPKYEEKKGEK